MMHIVEEILVHEDLDDEVVSGDDEDDLDEADLDDDEQIYETCLDDFLDDDEVREERDLSKETT